MIHTVYSPLHGYGGLSKFLVTRVFRCSMVDCQHGEKRVENWKPLHQKNILLLYILSLRRMKALFVHSNRSQTLWRTMIPQSKYWTLGRPEGKEISLHWLMNLDFMATILSLAKVSNWQSVVNIQDYRPDIFPDRFHYLSRNSSILRQISFTTWNIFETFSRLDWIHQKIR